MQESFAAEHGCEEFRHTSEHLLDSGPKCRKCDGHLEALGGMSQTLTLMLFGIGGVGAGDVAGVGAGVGGVGAGVAAGDGDVGAGDGAGVDC